MKELTVLIYDHGRWGELARSLAPYFKKVYYYMPWECAFPNIHQGAVMTGVEGVERVESVWDVKENVDLFIFPDIYAGAMQEKLVEWGFDVWGSRRGEELELYRELCKEKMRAAGLPVSPYKVAKGMTALKMAAQGDKWVKLDFWRGVVETFNGKYFETVAPEIERSLGGIKEELTFVVEDNLPDCVEIGYDGYVIDGQFPKSCIAGIEVKDKAYVAIFKKYSELPKEITDWNNRMAPILKGYGWRGNIHTEIRVGKNHIPYMIDLCARFGSPPMELMLEMFSNWPEIFVQGAKGIVKDPICQYKYGTQLIIKSNWVDKNWQPISFDEKFKRNIKITNLAIVDGKYFSVPQSTGAEFGSVLGWGNSLEEARAMCLQAAETIEGYDIEINMGALDEAEAEIEKLRQYGINLF